MAPTEGLIARDSICGAGYRFDGRVCVRSGWHFWGRWVLAGILLFVGFLLIVFCLCCSARARRRGNRPFGGTGWLGGGSKTSDAQQQQQQGYYGMSNQGPGGGGGGGGGGYDANQPYQYGGQGGYPPAYGQPPQEPPYNPSDGYYTGQQYGVQRPDNAYQPPK